MHSLQSAVVDSSGPTVPRQSQPIATLRHRHAAAAALAQRARDRSRTPFGAAAAVVPPPAVPALVWVLSPAHRWAATPRVLIGLLERLLRGHTDEWSVLVYTSRAKALEHATNIQRRPVGESSGIGGGAVQEATSVLCVVCCDDPAGVFAQVSHPLNVPLIYLGSDASALGDVSARATSGAQACARLDEVLGAARVLRASMERSTSSLGGLPLGAGLHALWAARADQRKWDAFDDRKNSDPVNDSRPTSPATMQRRVKLAWQRQKQDADTGTASSSDIRTTHNPTQFSRSRVIPGGVRFSSDETRTSRPSSASERPRAHTSGLTPSASSTTIPASSTHPPPTRLFSPSKRQLRIDLEASLEDAALSLLSPASARSNASPGGGGGRVTSPFRSTSSSASRRTSAPTSPLLSPRRTVRNPFGTPDGQPSPAQLVELSRAPLGPGPLSSRPIALVPNASPPAPITLSVQTPEDTARIAAIQALAARLNSYALPAASKDPASSSHKVSPGDVLPSTSARARRDALEVEFARSHTVPESVRRMLLAERARLDGVRARHLNRAESEARRRVAAHEATHAEWLRTQDANLFELQQTRDKQIRIEAEAVVERHLGARAYRDAQLVAARVAAEEDVKRRRAERVRAFNEAQSTARAVALSRVPDAPQLTRLQAVFLSPRSRKEVGGGTTHAGNNDGDDNGGSKSRSKESTKSPSRASTPLSPRVRIAASLDNRPSRARLEEALRSDYAELDATRRVAERARLELEGVLWAKRRQVLFETRLAEMREDDESAERFRREKAQRKKRVQFKEMLHEAFSRGGDDTSASEEDSDQEEDRESRSLNAAKEDPIDDFDADVREWERECQARAMQEKNPTFSAHTSLRSTGSASTNQSSTSLFDALSPSRRVNPPAAVVANTIAASRAAAEDAKEAALHREERRVAWSAHHPAMPPDILRRRTHVERRNPHERQEMMRVVEGQER